MKINSINKKDLLSQLFRFFIVGFIATMIDWVIYYILFNYIHIEPLIANIFSFSISLIYNYFASVKWVFNVDKEKSEKVMFVQFITFSVIGFFISELLLFVFIHLLFINEMFSKIIATAIVMVFNYVTRKMFLENKNLFKLK